LNWGRLAKGVGSLWRRRPSTIEKLFPPKTPDPMAVATISGMNQARPARKSMWRFSLRELLLVMLAAAALIGWATVLYRSRELKPTPFFIKHENWRQDVIEVFQELGEPTFNSAAGTTMHSEGSSAVQRTMVFRLPLSPDKQSEFLTAFQKRVR